MTTAETNQQIRSFLAEMADFLVKKNSEYDDTWRRPSFLVPDGGPKERLLYRLEEKLHRLTTHLDEQHTRRTITDGVPDKPALKNMSDAALSGDIIDTARDLVGYFTLLTMLLLEERSRQAVSYNPEARA